MSQGSCRCGEVRFRADGAPLITMACHCKGCQRMSSSAFSLSSLYPAAQFEVEQGEAVRGGLKSGPKHMFCGSCSSWLFTIPDGLEDFVNVRSSLFDDAVAHRPYADMWLGQGLGWSDSGAERRFETEPGEEEFGDLIAGYAGWERRVTQ